MNPLSVRKYLFEYSSYKYLFQLLIAPDQPIVGPLKTIVFLTNRCNNSCIGCYNKNNNMEMPIDVVKELVNSLKNMGSKEIIFSGGGEPFCYKHIHEIIKFSKGKSFKVSVNTSGVFSSNDIDNITKNKVDELFISLWASDVNEYKETHNGKDYFNLIVNNIHKLRQSSHKIRITIVNIIMKQNFKSLEKMLQIGKKYNTAVQFRFHDTSGLNKKDLKQFVLNNYELSQIKKNVETLKGKFNKSIFLKKIAQKLNDDNNKSVYKITKRCHAGWLICKIEADGNVFPCCGSSKKLGNINQKPFEIIWNSNLYTKFRQRSRKNLSQLYENHTCLTYCPHSEYNNLINKFLKF